MTPDQEQRAIDGGWNEYARLVLAELQRHAGSIDRVEAKLNELLAKEGAKEERDVAFRRDVERQIRDMDDKHTKQYEKLLGLLENPEDGLVSRVDDLESKDSVRNAIQLDRKWIVGLIVAFVFTVTLPTITFIRDLQGS